MAKVTRNEVEHYLSVLNGKLARIAAKYRYKVQGVAGGYSLEKYDSDNIHVDTCIYAQPLRTVYEIIRFTANTFTDNVAEPVQMYWNDPDDGICSQYVDIVSRQGETVTVSAAGVEFEVLQHELSLEK